MIRAPVDIARERAGEDVKDPQATQTFLCAIPATKSREVQRVERNTMEEACQEAKQQATLEDDPPVQAAAHTIKEAGIPEPQPCLDKRRCWGCQAIIGQTRSDSPQRDCGFPWGKGMAPTEPSTRQETEDPGDTRLTVPHDL